MTAASVPGIRLGSVPKEAPPTTRPAAGVRPLGEQGERPRRKLLEAAKDVFRDRGYVATRVDDIAGRAGTSHGAFYLYFANKHEILEALAVETSNHMYALAEKLEGIDAGDAAYEQLRRWVDEFIDLYAEHSSGL